MPDIYDVAIVGAGPTGLALAIRLAQTGHDVLVLERHAEKYPLPRAVVFDSEAARGLAGCGIAHRFPEIREIADDYTWLDAEGEVLLRLPMLPVGESGWPDGNMMTQPVLEQVLAERAAELSKITIVRGATAVALKAEAEDVRLTAETTGGLAFWSARYVVGADGASSFVREQMDTTIEDLGFFYDWLIVDLMLEDTSPWVPMNRQICDPERPTTAVSGGPGKRRWEFMRMPGEDENFNTDETAWRLLASWGVTPDNATLERRALYTFQACWADRWRDGRLLIAGDAAHLMPPFAGMGMCSGIRDATNLAWKLDLVLRGVSNDSLLDSYSTERAAHVRNAIFLSVELGKVICELDPEAAADRNAFLKAADGDPAKAMPPMPPAALGLGALHHDADGVPLALAGQLAPHPLLRSIDGNEARADDVLGCGFVLYVDADVVGGYPVTERQRALLDVLDVQVVALTSGPAGPDTYAEPTPALLTAMRQASCEVCVVRPDFYFYGGAMLDGLEGLLDDLAADLHLAHIHDGTIGSAL